MTKQLFLARLAGTQAQMGAQHGKLAGADAERLFEFYDTMPERALAGGLGAVDRFLVRRIATAWQQRLQRERPVEFAERTLAFVEAARPGGSRADRARFARTIATMDSMQNCVSLAARMELGPFKNRVSARATAAAAPACSTVIAWGSCTHDGELAFARNFDFPGVGVWDAAPAFVVCKPEKGQRYGFFTSRGADTPVVTVVNEAGLVLAPHTRWHREVTWGGAMIVDVVHEIARSAETLEDAIRIARARPTSSSWGIAVGSARERSAIVLELAGPNVEIVRPRAGADYLLCTNRYRNEAMQRGQIAAGNAWSHHSDHREQRLRTLVEGRTAPLRPQDLIGFLGDRCDVAAPDRKRRFGSILAQPTNVHCVAIAPLARVAFVGVDRAPCCEGKVAELAWEWDGPQGGWELREDGLAHSGFTARIATDVVAPHDPATLHVREAVRTFEHLHDVGAARASIERAIGIDPDDPSLRLAAAWLALEDRAFDRAIVHVHAGLATETEPYRRGQLLACGARAAAPSDPALSRRWLDELDRHDCEAVDELRSRARRKRPLKTNLLMADAL